MNVAADQHLHTIRLFPEYDNPATVVVDDRLTEYDIEERLRKADTKFYDTPHGKRETISGHRGCLIVRSTVQFGNEHPKRRTVVFLYTDDLGESGPNVFTTDCPCGASVAQAKRYIDRMLEAGRRDV